MTTATRCWWLALALTACAGHAPQTGTAPQLLTPSVSPGGQVLLGDTAAGVPVQLDGQPMATAPLGSGVAFTVPDTILAGTHQIGVAGATLPLLVPPRVDAATAAGLTLQVRGAGWSPQAAPALTLEGQPLTVTVDASGTASAPLQGAVLYGPLQLTVCVKALCAAPTTLQRPSGILSGQVSFAVTSAPVRSLGVRPPSPVTGRLLLVPPGVSVPTDGLRHARMLPDLGVERLEYRDDAAAQAALTALRAQGLAARPDGVVHTDGMRAQLTDPALATQWFWPLERFPSAWTNTRGAGVTVAVVDTGVLSTHPDLVGGVLPGYDVLSPGSPTDDHDGHGTHVAGLVAAHGQVTGGAPQAQLLPVKVLDSDAGGSVADLAQGLLWAAGLSATPNPHPAQVINVSLGSASDDPVLDDAVARVLAAGVTIVAAAGNDGGPPQYPAALPGVLSVTAVAGPQTLYQPEYANRGGHTLLSALGGDPGAGPPGEILSTDLGPGGTPAWGLRAGTSMAAPQVSALAALARASGVPAPLVAATLTHSARDLGPPGPDPAFGYGLIDAGAALGQVAHLVVLARDPDGHLLAWTRVQNGSYRLAGVPLGVPLTLRAYQDLNGDGVLGEAGAPRSAAVSLLLTNSDPVTQNFTLAPDPAADPFPLPPQR